MATIRRSDRTRARIGIPAHWDNIPTLAAGTELASWSYNFGSLINGSGTITRTLGSSAPSWVSLSGNVLSGTIPDADSNQVYQIPVTISNTLGGVVSSDTAVFMLSVPDTIEAPMWATISDQTWIVGTATTLNLNNFATGDPTPTITLQSGTLPDGVTLSNGILTINATDNTQSGTLTFRATNSADTDDVTFDYEVNSPVPTWTADFPDPWNVSHGSELRVNLTNNYLGGGTPETVAVISNLDSSIINTEMAGMEWILNVSNTGSGGSTTEVHLRAQNDGGFADSNTFDLVLGSP